MRRTILEAGKLIEVEIYIRDGHIVECKKEICMCPDCGDKFPVFVTRPEHDVWTFDPGQNECPRCHAKGSFSLWLKPAESKPLVMSAGYEEVCWLKPYNYENMPEKMRESIYSRFK